MTISNDPIVIVSAVRTPMGGFQGDFNALTAAQLGAVAIKAAVERAGIAADSNERRVAARRAAQDFAVAGADDLEAALRARLAGAGLRPGRRQRAGAQHPRLLPGHLAQRRGRTQAPHRDHLHLAGVPRRGHRPAADRRRQLSERAT